MPGCFLEEMSGFTQTYSIWLKTVVFSMRLTGQFRDLMLSCLLSPGLRILTALQIFVIYLLKGRTVSDKFWKPISCIFMSTLMMVLVSSESFSSLSSFFFFFSLLGTRASVTTGHVVSGTEPFCGRFSIRRPSQLVKTSPSTLTRYDLTEYTHVSGCSSRVDCTGEWILRAKSGL